MGHRHITVNGDVVNVPSYGPPSGDVVAVRERSRSLETITNSLATRATRFDWLVGWLEHEGGKFITMPERAQIPRTSGSSSSWNCTRSKTPARHRTPCRSLPISSG